jgi:glutamate formiminotransferase/glutamate formiminotransferase/formiminotetrahydrofolate cyclodeaminase
VTGLHETTLEAVPNVSEGEDGDALHAIGRAFGGHGCRLLDVHSDADYGRSVFTIVGAAQALADALVAGAREVIAQVDVRKHHGVHPCIGALDVVPVVYLRAEDRGLARDEALGVANLLAGELELPVFLYGELATAPERRERAYFREGGIASLAERLADGELEPDFGPARLHPTAGAVLVAARPPLVAFNIEVACDEVEVARAIAARVREQGGGLPGVRAIGVALERRGVVQLSANVHDPFAVPLAKLVAAVKREAERDGAAVVGAELVGLAPAAALDGFPADVPLRGFDERRHVLEHRLGSQN